MRLLASTEFALRVLMHLAINHARHRSTEALAQEVAALRNHLHKIVRALADVGLVRRLRRAARRLSALLLLGRGFVESLLELHQVGSHDAGRGVPRQDHDAQQPWQTDFTDLKTVGQGWF